MKGKQMSNETRNNYINRIIVVINFIEKNLEQELSLKCLSKMACFSPFHFHRSFLAITGETLNAFITRKRIEKIAALLLTGTRDHLTDLAFKYGFNSANSFSRAFKKFYGVTPTAFTENFSKIGIAVLTYEKYICSINHMKSK